MTVSSPVKLLEVDEYLKVVCHLFSIGSSRPFKLTHSLMGNGTIASLGLIQTLTFNPVHDFMYPFTNTSTQQIWNESLKQIPFICDIIDDYSQCSPYR